MSRLFETTSINGIILENRFVRSATWEGMGTKDGFVTPGMIEVSEKLARGGVGLIMSGHAYISREGQAAPFQLGICSDEIIPGLADMTGRVHAAGGKIVAQLAHGGLLAPGRLTELEAVGPSPFEKKSGSEGREMTDVDIDRIVGAYAAAASRAKVAGFDGIQIHGAHGYLLNQFLSPFFNKRKDEYGGSIENRSRIVLKVLKAVREVVGHGFLVCIKMNSEDFLVDGFSVEDMIYTAKKLEENGIDAIELSGGTTLSGNNSPPRLGKSRPGEPEAYYEAAARRYKEGIKAPLILVGGIRTFETAERLVNEGVADYIALSRPLIREPGLINRWKSGDLRPAACVSDNGCFAPGAEGKGVFCVVEAREQDQREG